MVKPTFQQLDTAKYVLKYLMENDKPNNPMNFENCRMSVMEIEHYSNEIRKLMS